MKYTKEELVMCVAKVKTSWGLMQEVKDIVDTVGTTYNIQWHIFTFESFKQVCKILNDGHYLLKAYHDHLSYEVSFMYTGVKIMCLLFNTDDIFEEVYKNAFEYDLGDTQ